MFIGLSDSYHSLASPTNVTQKCWTMTPSWNACMSIQSFILRRCASASSSGLPAKYGLKCDQFNCGTSAGWIGCVGIGYTGGMGGCTGGKGGMIGGGWGAGGAGGTDGVSRPPSDIFTYNISFVFNIFIFINLILFNSNFIFNVNNSSVSYIYIFYGLSHTDMWEILKCGKLLLYWASP